MPAENVYPCLYNQANSFNLFFVSAVNCLGINRQLHLFSANEGIFIRADSSRNYYDQPFFAVMSCKSKNVFSAFSTNC
ncbi:MAG: hypothetical protein C4308_10680 [Chitinophagaceae bacterium]